VWSGRGRVALAGVGFSAIDRRPSRPLSDYALEAALAAAGDCGIELEEIDGLATYPSAPYLGALNRDGEDIVTPEFFMSLARMPNLTWYSHAGAGLILASLRDAVNALLADACNYVLVWRAMYVPPGTYGRPPEYKARGDAQFSAPYGIGSAIQWHAMAYRRYLELYGASRDATALLATSFRRNAQLNEHAFFAGRGLTYEEYMSSRWISDPLCLYDCDIPVTACAAIVMTTADRARALRHAPAYLAGIGQQTATRAARVDFALHDHIDSAASLVHGLWSDSGLSPGEISAAQLYDGFSPSVLYWLEAAGFCGRGEAHEFVRDGRISLTGELPTNTFGGSLSQGRLHGLGHVAEAVLQISGRAQSRQLPSPDAICVFDGSPMMRAGGMVLTRD
jgi:acetyl-CoA acetyltransferase